MYEGDFKQDMMHGIGDWTTYENDMKLTKSCVYKYNVLENYIKNDKPK